MTDEKLIAALKDVGTPISTEAAQRIGELKRTLGVMVEAYGGAIRESEPPEKSQKE